MATNVRFFNQIMTAIVIVSLIVLSFMVMKPILVSITWGIIFAFIFNPFYSVILKKTKSKNLSAWAVSLTAIIILAIFLVLILPKLLDQTISFFMSVQGVDLITPIQNLIPNFILTEELKAQIGPILSSFFTKTFASLITAATELVMSLPTIFLHLVVVAFTFFFVLRDKDVYLSYFRSMLPFPNETQNKILSASKAIANSVIFGQFILGVIQGIICGVGYFMFGIPNAFLLTLLTIFFGILPILGTPIIWAPVALFLFISGDIGAFIGILVIGIFASSIDNVLRPFFISSKAEIPASVVLIGMIGGLFLFGIVGLILGPLVLAYSAIVLEIYRNKDLAILNN